MKTQTYIEATIEYIFHSKNERNMMLAYILRTKLNWSPVQVGRHLRLSINQVNQLNTARLFTLSSDKYLHEMFKINHDKCEQACAEYVVYTFTREFSRQNLITMNRLDKRVKELQN